VADRRDYVSKTIRSAETFLTRWKGATARLWELKRPHTILRIVLSRENSVRENLVLVCVDPIRITGPVEWATGTLKVSSIALPGGREGFRIVDASGGVEIVCAGLEIKENLKL
jgi:hypothetical protein